MAQESITPTTPLEKELLERIRSLEEQNSALQDRLDMIWSILEPDYELPADADEEDGGGLVQINGVN